MEKWRKVSCGFCNLITHCELPVKRRDTPVSSYNKLIKGLSILLRSAVLTLRRLLEAKLETINSFTPALGDVPLFITIQFNQITQYIFSLNATFITIILLQLNNIPSYCLIITGLVLISLLYQAKKHSSYSR